MGNAEDRQGRCFIYDRSQKGKQLILCENEIESKIQISVCFFQFDPKIMIQMNSPEHGQGVGCGVEDDE